MLMRVLTLLPPSLTSSFSVYMDCISPCLYTMGCTYIASVIEWVLWRGICDLDFVGSTVQVVSGNEVLRVLVVVLQDVEITPSGFPELRSSEVTPRRPSDP